MVAPDGVKGAAAESGEPLGHREIQGSVTVVNGLRCAIAGGLVTACIAYLFYAKQNYHIYGGQNHG